MVREYIYIYKDVKNNEDLVIIKEYSTDGHGYLITNQTTEDLIYPEKVVVNGQVIGRNRSPSRTRETGSAGS